MCAVIAIQTIGKDVDANAAFSLHTACFGDEQAWFDAFLSAASGEQYLAALEDGRLVGGMFLPEATLYTKDKAYSGKYVYALGVHPDQRGQGIARALLRKAKEISRDFTLICAANESLAATYEKQGFDRYIGGTVKAGDMCGVRDMDISAYKKPCAYADAVKCGGVFLSKKLFAFSLGECCNAKLYTDGKSVIARNASGIYAAYGLFAKVEKKAQLYLKTEIDTSGIHADLILEV